MLDNKFDVVDEKTALKQELTNIVVKLKTLHVKDKHLMEALKKIAFSTTIERQDDETTNLKLYLKIAWFSRDNSCQPVEFSRSFDAQKFRNLIEHSSVHKIQSWRLNLSLLGDDSNIELSNFSNQNNHNKYHRILVEIRVAQIVDDHSFVRRVHIDLDDLEFKDSSREFTYVMQSNEIEDENAKANDVETLLENFHKRHELLTFEINRIHRSTTSDVGGDEIKLERDTQSESNKDELALYLRFYLPRDEPIFKIRSAMTPATTTKPQGGTNIRLKSSPPSVQTPTPQPASTTQMPKILNNKTDAENVDTFLVHLTESRCPFCFLRIDHFRAMICHLDLCHTRLIFEPDGLESDGVPVIAVGLCAETPVEVSSCERSACQVRETAHLGVVSACLRASCRETGTLFYLRARPRSRRLRRSKLGRWNCEALELNNSANSRTYYHSRSLSLISSHEIRNSQGRADDSDSEIDWLREHAEHLIDDFTDVNDGEKALMKMWNGFCVDKETMQKTNAVKFCESFISENVTRIVQQNLCRNFLLHLLNLLHFDIIDSTGLAKLVEFFKSQQVTINQSGSSSPAHSISSVTSFSSSWSTISSSFNSLFSCSS